MMAKMLNQRKKWLWLAMGLLIYGCGYRFPGGGEIPGGIQTISIPLFTNRTNEIDLENTLTNDLVNEFIIRRKKALADNDTVAEGILKGEITSVATHTIAQTEAGGAIEREVVVKVNLRLIDQKGEVVWMTRSVAEQETYDVGSGSIEAEQNRQAAIEELSDRLAEKIYNRLMEDF